MNGWVEIAKASEDLNIIRRELKPILAQIQEVNSKEK